MNLENKLYGLLSNVIIKGEQLYSDCPYCGDKSNHFTVNLQKGIWNCWKCGEQYSGKTVFNLLKFLGDEDEVDYKFRTNGKMTKAVKLVLPEYRNLAIEKNRESKLGKIAYKYILSRGITYDRIKNDGIGYCAIGEYAYRIILPILMNNKIVYFQARDFIGKHFKKYLNPKISRDGVLGNYDYVKGNTCIITEGYFGALHVGGVCLFGKTIKNKHCYFLSSKGFKQYIILIDGKTEKADTRLNVINIADALKKIGNVKFVLLPDGKQPDDFSRKQIGKYIQQGKEWCVKEKIRLKLQLSS